MLGLSVVYFRRKRELETPDNHNLKTRLTLYDATIYGTGTVLR
jgi:hypothetical protein